MKRRVLVLGLVCLLAAAWLAGTLPAQAEPTAVYQLVKSNIGPGQSGSSGIYTVSNSIGQPDVGQGSAGSYTLGGGFWGGGVIVSSVADSILLLPLVIR